MIVLNELRVPFEDKLSVPWTRFATAHVIGIQNLATLHREFLVIPELPRLRDERLLGDKFEVTGGTGRIFLLVHNNFRKIFKEALD